MKNFFLFLGVCLTFSAFGQAGSLDKTYGKGGFRVIEGGYNSSGFNLQLNDIQSDNKVVYVYDTFDDSLSENFIHINRVGVDGALDKTFGTKGTVKYKTEATELITSVKVAPNGKIWVLTAVINAVTGDIGLYRFNSNGVIDSTFNKKGFKNIGAPDIAEAALTMHLLPSGKLLLAGISAETLDDPLDATVFKINADGSFDNTFGKNGIAKALIVSPSVNRVVNDIAVDKSGNIFISGGGSDAQADPASGFIIKLKENGTIDATFGKSGLVEEGGPNGESTDFPSIELLDNDKILATIQIYNDDQTVSARVCRYLKTGVLDDTFGANGSKGFIDVNVGDNEETYPTDMKAQANGQILVNYSTYVSALGGYNNITSRYNVNGDVDNKFGKKGSFTVASDTADYYSANLMIQNDGKIIVSAESDLFEEQKAVRTFYRLLNPPAVATEDITLSANLSAMPNPMSNELSLKYNLQDAENELSIEFVNLQGQVVKNPILNEKRNAGQQNETFNVSDLNSGVYFVRIKTPTKIAQLKVVKI